MHQTLSLLLAAWASTVAVNALPADGGLSMTVKRHSQPKRSGPSAHSSQLLNEVLPPYNIYAINSIFGAHQQQQLFLDTKSGLTYTFGQQPGESSSLPGTFTTSVTSTTVQGPYSDGETVSGGNLWKGPVSLAGLTAKNLTYGANPEYLQAEPGSSEGFVINYAVSGVLGLGRPSLTKGETTSSSTVPTFLDEIYSQGDIPTKTIALYLQPENNGDEFEVSSLITFGGTNSSLYSGELTYFPFLTTGNASAYYALPAKFSYNPLLLPEPLGSSDTVLDIGTSYIYLPSAAFQNFLSATGGTVDANTGLASFAVKPTGSLDISFGALLSSFNLTPDQYLVPENQYGNYGFDSTKYYAFIASGDSSVLPGGVESILGIPFLQAYYSVYDLTNSRIGLAPAVPGREPAVE